MAGGDERDEGDGQGEPSGDERPSPAKPEPIEKERTLAMEVPDPEALVAAQRKAQGAGEGSAETRKPKRSSTLELDVTKAAKSGQLPPLPKTGGAPPQKPAPPKVGAPPQKPPAPPPSGAPPTKPGGPAQRSSTLLGLPEGPAGDEPEPERAAEPEPVARDSTEPMSFPPTGATAPPAADGQQEPSLELDIELEETRGPVPSGGPKTSGDAPEASGTFKIHRGAAPPPNKVESEVETERADSSGPRRKRRAAGVHPSLAGMKIRPDTDAYAAVEEDGDPGASGSSEPAPPPEPRSKPRRGSEHRPDRTGTFASVGPRATGALQALANAALRTGIHTGLIKQPEPEGDWDKSKTGYYKPLPTTRRIIRVWEELGLRLGQRVAEAVGDDHLYLLLMAVIVGVASGATAGLLLLWIARAVELFPAVGQAFPRFGWIYLILAPALGGLMVGGLRFAARKWLGDIPEGIPAVIEAVGQQGRLKGSSGGILGLGTGITIASGGSVGHEGPTVAIGATVGSVLGRFFGLRMRRQTTMLGAGCAAGLAAAFNAPLAGVIFTVEVVFKRSVGGNIGSMSVFTPLIVAAVAGTFTSHAIFGERTELIAPGDVAGDALLLEMIFFLALAVLAGLLSPLMSRVVLFCSELFERIDNVPQWVKPALGGLGVGLLGTLLFTDLLGPGRGIVFDALHSELTWQIAIGLALLKIVATALTIGSGGMGGVFMPSLVIGACVGTVVHALALLVIGAGVSAPAAYALVGMGAYLGATLRAPLTPIVMIFELTGDYGLILPLMFACILSAFVAGRVEKDTLFDLTLRRKGSGVLDTTDDGAVMRRGHVGDLMVRPDHMLRLDSSFDEVQRAALVEDTPTLYVLDDNERVAAVIDSRMLAARALRGEIPPDATAGDLASKERPTLLIPEDTLAGAMMAFARSGRDVLPVVDADRHILGLIERTDLMAHYSEKVLEQRDEELQIHGGAGLDHEVNLGMGVTLERVVVGRRWAGRTLAELSLRQTVHVQVLEWQRDDELLEIDPHRPLREGDILALAGNRENLLAARWVQ